MKKYIIFLGLFLMPVFVFASINQNLYYGLTKNDSVKELQQLLINKGFLTGLPTGNFFTQTKNAVKKYQASKNISTTGTVGPLTIKAINADLAIVQNNNSTPITSPNLNSVISSATSPSVAFGGSLDLAQNTTYLSQSTIVPKSKFKLAYYSLKNNTTEPINLKSIEVDLAINSDPYLVNMYVSNLFVAYGKNSTAVITTGMGNNVFSVNSQLPAGQTIDVVVYGDISSTILLNSIINSSVLVSGVSSFSSTEVNTNSNIPLAGQNITYSLSSLTATQDTTNPSARTSVVGKKILAGKFQFTSTADSYKISELKFIVPNSNAISVISDIVLTDATTDVVLSTVPTKNNYIGDNSIFDFNVNISIPFNSNKSINVYYIFNKSIDSNITNTNIAPILVYLKGFNGPGTIVDGSASNYTNISTYYGGIILPAGGVVVNSLVAFKSFPALSNVASQNTKILNNSNVDVYTISVTADPNGNVGVKQFTFLITLNDPARNNFYLNNFSFSKNHSDYTGSVTIGNIFNNIPVGLSSDSGIQPGLENKIEVSFVEDEVIAAGKTETYTLKAHANNVSSGDTISTYFPSDSEIINGGSYLRAVSSKTYCGLSKSKDVNISPVNYYNFLWSDMSETYPDLHINFNGAYTNDWYNGSLVLGLPLSTQVLTAQ